MTTAKTNTIDLNDFETFSLTGKLRSGSYRAVRTGGIASSGNADVQQPAEHDGTPNSNAYRAVKAELHRARTEAIEAQEVIAAANKAIWSSIPSTACRGRVEQSHRHGDVTYDIPETIAALGAKFYQVDQRAEKLESELGVVKQAATDAQNKYDRAVNSIDVYRKECDRLTVLASQRASQIVDLKQDNATVAGLKAKLEDRERKLEEYRGIVVSKKDYEALKQKLARAEARVDEANNLALRKAEEARDLKRALQITQGSRDAQYEEKQKLRAENRGLKLKLAQADSGLKAKIDAVKVASFYNGFPTFGSRA